ncbi:glutamyl-tRNA reductase [uncultured Meiothermus sp.]|jgi:glutamyl-tRNA reductase|uniref:glutamyl-tRNA reductase n=1 Tax=uncultured Meiothermus sp. TaxID=157471 RepID=UPI00262CB879|nr:glutamyl-tRNA reductase [uncultured Meiothermus sp.]
MKRLALIGVSQRRGGTAALQAWNAWAQTPPGWPGGLITEAVPIATCNRTDLVLALAEGVQLEDVRAALVPPHLPRGYAFAGEAALEHLCRVATSLDSLNPGEDQIMQQVRQAFETARQAGAVGPITSFAFQSALRIAKRVRREVPLAPANTSLFSLARPEFEARLPRPARVAVLGIGEMGSLAARSLATNPGIELWLVNRTGARAEELARELGAKVMLLDAFLEHPPAITGLVTATSVKHLIGRTFVKNQPELRAIVDLGLPPNVERTAVEGRPVALIDLEWMQRLGEARRQRLRADLARAEQIVAEELDTTLSEWAEREMGPAIAQMREVYRRTLEETVGELVEPELVQRLAHRFAHFPARGLRGLARKHGAEAAQVFLQEAGLGLEEKEPNRSNPADSGDKHG